MATVKSSDDHLTLNADGSSKNILFQADGVQKASISSAGLLTSTTIDATVLTGNLPAISAASLTAIPAANITGTIAAVSGVNLTALNATNLGSGTVPAARITASSIANDLIDSQHYAAASIDTAHIANDQITAALMADNSIDSDMYVDGSIDNAHLADDAVDSDEIAAGAIDAAHMAANSVDSASYVDGSIDEVHLSDNSVDSRAYVDGSIDVAHMSANSVDSDQYVDGSIDAVHFSTSIGDLSGKGISHIGVGSNDYIYWAAGSLTKFYVNGNEEMRLEADGDLHVDADVIAYSTTISDATLKYNINPVEFALDKIKQLKGVTFNYFKNDRESAGLLAQDVEKVMPSAVQEKKIPLHKDDDKAYKTLHYDSVTAILVEAIKELTAKVEKLENK